MHLAKDTRLDRKVAIKLLHVGGADRSVSRERFQSEAKAVSSLNHPHICTLYDVGEQDGHDYLVMELLEGETIARRLSRGPLPPDQILRHAIEIAEALDHAHRHRIVSVDGRDVRQVTHGDGEHNVMPTWSGDGAFLYFYRWRPTKSFRKIPVEGGTSTELAAWDYFRERGAQVDPQGRAVVYTLAAGGQTNAAVVRDLGSGKEHTLGRTIYAPRWSPDSQTIFGWYTAPDPSGDIWNRWLVAACPADGLPCRAVTRGFGAIPSGDGSRLFYVRDTGADRNMREVWTVSLDGGNPRRVATIGPLPSDWSYDVSPRDQIVFTRLNASRRELWVAQLK